MHLLFNHLDLDLDLAMVICLIKQESSTISSFKSSIIVKWESANEKRLEKFIVVLW